MDAHPCKAEALGGAAQLGDTGADEAAVGIGAAQRVKIGLTLGYLEVVAVGGGRFKEGGKIGTGLHADEHINESGLVALRQQGIGNETAGGHGNVTFGAQSAR